MKTPPEPAHVFKVTLEQANFTEEKYKLYENYQIKVHHDPPERISRDSFRRFLCESPLKSGKDSFDGRDRLMGSVHQCYRLDGKLVAIGVLDLLPQCVSGVYFLYHEDVSAWNFGKLSALREAALALEGGYRCVTIRSLFG